MGSTVKTGKVKWFNAAKGFGFLSADGIDGDIFVHYSNITGEGYKTLDEGDSVQFELDNGDKGIFAKNITKVKVTA